MQDQNVANIVCLQIHPPLAKCAFCENDIPTPLRFEKTPLDNAYEIAFTTAEYANFSLPIKWMEIDRVCNGSQMQWYISLEGKHQTYNQKRKAPNLFSQKEKESNKVYMRSPTSWTSLISPKNHRRSRISQPKNTMENPQKTQGPTLLQFEKTPSLSRKQDGENPEKWWRKPQENSMQRTQGACRLGALVKGAGRIVE